MTVVFVAGSITIKKPDARFVERLDSLIASELDIVVGDANGADKEIQKVLLAGRASSVTVFCSGDSPRNNLGNWPVRYVQTKAQVGTRAFFTAKDLEMAGIADFGLMLWDAKSTGTLANVIELMKRGKKSVVFVNSKKAFAIVSDAASLHRLVDLMSDTARVEAEDKIGLSAKMRRLDQEQFGFSF